MKFSTMAVFDGARDNALDNFLKSNFFSRLRRPKFDFPLGAHLDKVLESMSY